MGNSFSERLKQYREELNIKTKREMAKKIGISEQLYYMLESGSREKPSNDVLNKLFLISGKPEEYWLYGVTADEYVDKREDFKCSKDMALNYFELGILDEKSINNLEGLDDAAKKVLLVALQADLTHLYEKYKSNKKG